MAKNIRIKRYSKRIRCTWFNIFRNLSFANRTKNQELYFLGHRHFHSIHTQLVIDNAGYIYYAETRILGNQNNAKQFTMMQQICANGPLHFPEDCVILAEYLPKSTPNSCAIYNTTNKPKTRTPVQSTCRCRCRCRP